MILLENLRYRTLDIESLSIGPGITSVIGRNGSGKTSLLRLCAGIALPETGVITIEGTSPRQSSVGWVNEFPDRNFLFDSVFDEIASALRFQHLPPGEVATRTDWIMERLGIARLASRSVRDLSGGKRVLVALASAMVTGPRILIIDECDSHLDSRCTKTIDDILRASQIPFILRSTQDMETAAGSDQVVFLEQGQARYSGPPGTVFSDLADSPFYPMSWRCRR
jgi:energy-coupling factor transport system ATP-binding protein